MSPDEQAYGQVVDKIIEGQVKLLGLLAITKAKNVDGFQIDDEGRVISISGDPKQIIHNLVLKYEEVAGETASKMCKIAISKLKEEYPGLELPEELA